MTLTRSDLSSDQAQVFRAILDWTARPTTPLLTVGGYAGTGKSTLLGLFAKEASLRVAYAAFTGRAASVLRRKLADQGVATVSHLVSSEDGGGGEPYCGTLHGLFYRPVLNEKEEITGWTRRQQLAHDMDLLVVDEASMVSDDMLHDLLTYRVPVLAVGDHGQLAPVRAEGNLMQRPMLRLETVHRQSADNPIIALAHHVRQGRTLRDFFRAQKEDGRVRAIYRKALGGALTRPADPSQEGMVCWTNRTRCDLNRLARACRGHTSALPSRGEWLMALQNRRPVCNGMRGACVADAEPSERPGASWSAHVRVVFAEEGIEAPVMLCVPQLGRAKTFATAKEMQEAGVRALTMADWTVGALYDWGYAMTVHKAQGSQFAHGLVILDRPERPEDEDYRRWMYTAITRASERLTMVV